jgi:hypothetical protein
MKTTALRGVFMTCALVLAGCSRPAEHHDTTSNPEIEIEELFTHHGCTVYRFYDSPVPLASPQYYVDCGPGSASVVYRRSCGKGCTYEQSTITVNARK